METNSKISVTSNKENSTATKGINTDFLKNMLSKVSQYNPVSVSSESKGTKLIYKIELRNDLTKRELRSKRNKLRDKLENFSFEMDRAIRNQFENTIKDVCKRFNDYYKENYILNDFTLNSVRSTISESKKIERERIEVLLQTCKHYLSQS